MGVIAAPARIQLLRDVRMVGGFQALPSAARRVGTFTETVKNGSLKVLQTVAAANRIVEYELFGLNGGDNSYELRSGDLIAKVSRFRCSIGSLRAQAWSTATAFAGIELGTFNAAPPFTATPTEAVAQLRVRSSDDKIEFLTGVGDGSAVVVDVLTIPTAPHYAMLELLHDPIARAIYALVDGVVVASRSGASYPDFGAFPGLSDTQYGVFLTSGTNAAATPELWASFPEIEIIGGGA